MEIALITLVALAASLLTFFSGFGLGTILTPFMAIFFPVETAIALTGIVHLLNNLFKFVLVRRHVDWPVVLRFGITAIMPARPWARCCSDSYRTRLHFWFGRPVQRRLKSAC
jgi:uncharacterized membrane protein YfcA